MKVLITRRKLISILTKSNKDGELSHFYGWTNRDFGGLGFGDPFRGCALGCVFKTLADESKDADHISDACGKATRGAEIQCTGDGKHSTEFLRDTIAEGLYSNALSQIFEQFAYSKQRGGLTKRSFDIIVRNIEKYFPAKFLLDIDGLKLGRKFAHLAVKD